MVRRCIVLIIIAASVSLAACAAGPSPAAQSTPAQVPPTAAPAETTSAPPTAAPAETTSAPPTAAPAETTSAPSQSPEAPPTAAASPAAGAGRLAWPARLPDGHQLRPEQSSADADQLQLMLADPANAQDFITIGSVPDSGEGFGMQCKDTVQVRGQSGVVCTTGGGATVQWVEQGWRYSIGGGLMSGERAVAIAETLEFVDLATARQRLGQ